MNYKQLVIVILIEILMLLGTVIYFRQPEPLTCMVGTILLSTPIEGTSVIGEQVICARDWQISSVFETSLNSLN